MIYNSKIPTRTSELVNDSSFVSNTKLPVICFDFDQLIGTDPQTAIDSRFTILKSYGFTGNVVESGNAEITKKLVKMGFDISPYIGNHSSFDYATDTNGNLAQNITEKMTRLEGQGIYNPIMISCSGHKDAEILEEELDADYNVKFIRARSFYKKDYAYHYPEKEQQDDYVRIMSAVFDK